MSLQPQRVILSFGNLCRRFRCDKRWLHSSFVVERRGSGFRGRSSPFLEEPLRMNAVIEEAQTGDADPPIDPKELHVPFPSDRVENRISKDYGSTKHAFRVPTVDPSQTSILLFPGQGSQFVGMGEGLLKYPDVPRMYKTASDILGYNLLDLCTRGPAEKLNKTIHCQPAILVASLAAVQKLKEENPEAISKCVGAAGFSVGEFAALVFAGAMSFEEAVEVIKVRATAMQKASEAAGSGMMSVFLNADHKVKLAMLAAKQYCLERCNIERPVCQVANYMYPECKVIAGHNEALDFIEETKRDFGIKRVKRLPVSGAFHTQLMEPAAKPLKRALESVNLQEPIIYVHSNVTTYRHKNVDIMKNNLVKQVYKPVKWEQILHTLYWRKQGLNFPQTYEVGPGRQLGVLLKMTNATAHKSYKNVDV